MIAIIGSGPSAVAAAQVLCEAGVEVTVLDAGLTLESRYQESVDAYLGDQDADRFLGAIGSLETSASDKPKASNDKLLFGSDFPYRGAQEYVFADAEAADIRASLALGGLSNVWGSAVLPAVESDIADWPISAGDLTEHYRALGKIMDITSEPDGLDAVFGEMFGRPADFPLGRQGQELMAHMNPHRDALAGKGIHFGRARLAVGKGNSADGIECRSCGLCMHGCPYGSIFNASQVIGRLRGSEEFSYRGNLIVEEIAESGENVTIKGHDLRDGTPYAREFDRVLIAAGAISTTSIIVRSLNWYDLDLRLRDSQHFYFPVLRFNRAVGVMTEEANRLAQVFVDIGNPDVCERLVHLQVYGFDHLVFNELRARFGRSVELFSGVVRRFVERLLLVQGFLHSDVSGQIHVEWPERQGDKVPLPRLVGKENPISRNIIHRTNRHLSKEWRSMQAAVLPGQLKISPPGFGRHIGGSLPMQKNPGKGETDLLGRPMGMQRVHAIDASVLPSIPATTITYTVMANASRIATTVAGLAKE